MEKLPHEERLEGLAKIGAVYYGYPELDVSVEDDDDDDPRLVDSDNAEDNDDPESQYPLF